MSKKPKAVVLLSGGMDSCVTASVARETHELALMHASYGQRTERRERQAFDEIADFYDVRKRLVVHMHHLAQIGGSALTDTRIPVPERKAEDLVSFNTLGMDSLDTVELVMAIEEKYGMRIPTSDAEKFACVNDVLEYIRKHRPADSGNEIPPTYVPFRNAHFLAVAVSWAEVIGATAVFIGAVAEDSSGYPDCRPEYYRVFQQLIREGTRPETRIEIVTPVIRMRKWEIVKRGMELGAPLDKTWSCYQFEDAACGVCDSCRLRLRAFVEAGINDPIAYRVQVGG